MHDVSVYICRIGERGETLLAQAARAYGLRELPQIARTERGKPFFLGMPGVHFSVSHSGALWCAAFCAAPVGVDVQRMRKCSDARIARRFFHPDEAAYVEKRGARDFFAVWAAKESYVKLTGQGIDESFSRFRVVQEDALCGRIGGVRYAYLDAGADYVLCVCAEALGKTDITWLPEGK